MKKSIQSSRLIQLKLTECTCEVTRFKQLIAAMRTTDGDNNRIAMVFPTHNFISTHLSQFLCNVKDIKDISCKHKLNKCT